MAIVERKRAVYQLYSTRSNFVNNVVPIADYFNGKRNL